MIPAVALHEESSVAETARVPTRADVIARYRHLRGISKEVHNKAFTFVSGSAIQHQARRLGLSHGSRLIFDSEAELDLLSDLIVYTAPSGRSRALDRYARNLPPPPGSDEALMLEAMRNAHYGILQMQRRHPAAGMILRDDARDEEIWLVDLGYETWMKEGMLVATRYYTPGPFSMSAGAGIPLDRPLIARAVESVECLWRKGPAEMCDDPRFAEALCRTAIEHGVMERVRLQDPPAGGYAA